MAVCGFGLDPRRPISQYQKRHWEVENGLPHNYILALAPAADGYLLVGTDEGLARFDGVRFTPFEEFQSLKLSARWIAAMLRAADGSRWIGTFDGWLFKVRAHKVEGAFEVGASVFSILEASDGVIWVSSRRGVLRVANGRLAAVEGLAPPSETAWNVLARGARNSVWVVTREGLFRYRDHTITAVAGSREQRGEPLSVYGAGDGNLWMGTSSGLFRLRGGPHGVEFDRITGVPGPVVAILCDRDGLLWAGSWGHGLYRVRPSGAVDSWSVRDGLADDSIRTLYEDGEGNLWIGTRAGGLACWKDTPLIPYGVPEGLGGNFASTVAHAPDGRPWLGTWRGGLYRNAGDRFLEQPTPVPASFCAIRALAIDGAGHPWIGNWEGLFGYNGRRYEQFAAAGSPYHSVSAILFDRAHRLWVGTPDHGLFLFPKGKPSPPEGVPYLPGAQITALFQDSLERVWAGTSQGFGWWAGSGFHPVDGIPRDFICSVTEDSRRRIWAPTLSGSIALVTGRGTTVLDRRHGLPGYPLYRAVEDSSGSLWISSAKGILEIRADQVDELLSNTRRRLDITVYGAEDGMRTVECHRLSQPAGGRDAAGSVWFPTTRGFVAIERGRVRPDPAPPVLIEEVVSDGRRMSLPDEVRLAPAARRLEIRYTAPYFSSPEKVQFRYRLEDFDQSWVEAGAERTARYSSLPPGRYRFVVADRLPGGAWHSIPAPIAIRQMPRFHQTAWFLLLMLAAAAVAAAGIVRWREHVIRGRYALIAAERNRIAREWHDTLVAGFSAISWQLEETLSRLRDSAGAAAETVNIALKMVHHYRTEARRVIWSLRENRPESESLAGAVAAALDQLTAGAGIAAQVRVEGRPVKLPEDVERNILRITQEAGSNAKNHGRPAHIEIHLAYRPGRLDVRIADDGTGFDPQQAAGVRAGHFGLTMMRERAEHAGGKLRLESRPGEGTIVVASFPLTHE